MCPPPAPQTCGGGANALDTGDDRFVNASAQIGDLLYQVHTIALGGFSAPRYYVISGLLSFSPAVSETGLFFASGSSFDFNASIAADSSGELAMTWSASDPTGGLNSEVRYVGRQAGDAAINGVAGASLINSGVCLTGNFDANFGMQRWGDYSAVSVDPLGGKKFWVINEDILDANTWGTEFGVIHF